MSRREPFARTGLWLACGGLAILATHQLLTMYRPPTPLSNLPLAVVAIAGYLITAIGVVLSTTRRPRTTGAEPESAARPLPAHSNRAAPTTRDTARRMTGSFLNWCDHDLDDANVWSSFDQLVRELLTEQLGAAKIRCFQVLPGDQQLRGLSQHTTTADGQCARTGILGHVATTGKEFVAADPAHGELIQQLADDTDEAWDWVYPIAQNGPTTGLVAVGKIPSTTLFNRERRQELAVLITTFWRHVACLERLRVAEKIDKASGLLTRADFFAVATRALADSYAENEPVVVVALALEGLRRLDDVGRWSDRDRLVETIGLLVNRRIRTDDIIGRFSDDRFVLLLRRLDSGLGRLIATKIQETAREQIAKLDCAGANLRVRAGLAGSGFNKQPLEELLVSAFDAVEQARRQNVALHCDLTDRDSERGPAPPAATSATGTHPDPEPRRSIPS